MSFGLDGKYQVAIGDVSKAEKQLDIEFIPYTITMTIEDFGKYIEDLKIEAVDYWYGMILSKDWVKKDRYCLCEFGFINETDAMGFKLRWM